MSPDRATAYPYDEDGDDQFLVHRLERALRMLREQHAEAAEDVRLPAQGLPDTLDVYADGVADLLLLARRVGYPHTVTLWAALEILVAVDEQNEGQGNRQNGERDA